MNYYKQTTCKKDFLLKRKIHFLIRSLLLGSCLTIFYSSTLFAQSALSAKKVNTTQKITGNYISPVFATNNSDILFTQSEEGDRVFTFTDISTKKSQQSTLISKVLELNGVAHFELDDKKQLWTLVTNENLTKQTIDDLFSLLGYNQETMKE